MTFSDRVDVTAAALREAAGVRGFAITADDRISEGDLGELLSMNPRALADMRTEGRPLCPWYRFGSCRASYRISEVALALENTRRAE